ncbi:MAG: hypothetical protein J5994_01195 [Ruminococcus sp.]|nr:hypothetical protein [Ruminococcus sp.]
MKKLLAIICSVLCVGLCACGEVRDDSVSSKSYAAADSVTEENETENTGESSVSDSEADLESAADSQSADVSIEDAKNAVRQLVEYANGGAYSKLKYVMTEELFEEIPPSEDGEETYQYSVSFEDDKSFVNSSADGYTYISFRVILTSPDDEITTDITVRFDGQNYLISDIGEEGGNRADSQPGDNVDSELAEGAKDCITKWTEYMSNAEYSKAAELMTGELAEETSMSEMTDGEDPSAAEVTFGSVTSVSEAMDGSVYIELEVTLIPESDPDFKIPIKATVVYDGEKYLFSSFDEYDNDEEYADSIAKTVFNAAAVLTADMETEGKTVPDGDYDKNSDSEYAERLNEILRDYDIGGDHTVTIRDGMPLKATYTEDGYTGQYPNEHTVRTNGN